MNGYDYDNYLRDLKARDDEYREELEGRQLMSWIPCPVCGKPRSDTVTAPDGDHVVDCAHCGDPGWIRPPDSDDLYAGRPTTSDDETPA